MLYLTVPFVVGWLLIALAQNFFMVLFGRFVTGSKLHSPIAATQSDIICHIFLIITDKYIDFQVFVVAASPSPPQFLPLRRQTRALEED